MSFTGYIEIPEKGLYTFYTKSDDGSHAVKEEYGKISLNAATHAVKVEYIEDWSGIEKQPVPASILFMDPGSH